MKSPIQFSHETRVYVFRGKELSPMNPGTYDASKWTPPSHQVFNVEIQSDGFWVIKLHGARITSGEGATRSRSAAADLILKNCEYLFTE